MEKEDLLKKRFQDLSRAAERKGCPSFSDFLNLNEQHILNQTLRSLGPTRVEIFGGYETAERRMVAFLPSEMLWTEDYGPEAIPSETGLPYPIVCVRICPKALKFAEKLSHRDFLGALMHLGIDRSRFGDIAVEEARAYVFCQQSIVGLITEELTQVRHTQVSCSVCTPSDFSYSPTTLVVRGSIASVRLDSLLSLAFGSSRSSVLPWIEGGIVFVNGKLITTNAHMPREGDIISVRGQGRFRYGKVVAQTKKGRLMAEVEKYI